MIKKTIAGMLAISTLIAALPITAATTVSAEGSYTVPELSLENKSVPETDSMKKSLDDMFDTLYVAFVQQNIPVVIGEFGATNRDNTQARTDQTAYYYAAARARGISSVCGITPMLRATTRHIVSWTEPTRLSSMTLSQRQPKNTVRREPISEAAV